MHWDEYWVEKIGGAAKSYSYKARPRQPPAGGTNYSFRMATKKCFRTEKLLATQRDPRHNLTDQKKKQTAGLGFECSGGGLAAAHAGPPPSPLFSGCKGHRHHPCSALTYTAFFLVSQIVSLTSLRAAKK